MYSLKNTKVSKKIFHKFLFIIPLLGIILSYANGINTTTFENNNKSIVVHSEKNTLKALSLFHEIEETGDYSDFFYEESELEDNIEFNWFICDPHSETYSSILTEKLKLYNKPSFCLIQKSTPLYDLFCKWKLNLS